jgi:hypothetical protein
MIMVLLASESEVLYVIGKDAFVDPKRLLLFPLFSKEMVLFPAVIGYCY